MSTWVFCNRAIVAVLVCLAGDLLMSVPSYNCKVGMSVNLAVIHTQL